MKKKKSIFECKRFCPAELSSIIVKLHVLTGSDSTSGFFGRGKKSVIKNVLKKIAQAKLMLEEIGESLQINEIIYSKVILLVMRYVLSIMTGKANLWQNREIQSGNG